MLQSISLDIADVLRRAGLPGDLFSRKEASISAPEYFRLWEAIEAASDNPYAALDMIEGLSADFFDPVLFAAFCSSDLNTALERIRQFKPLIGPLRLIISKSSKQTSVEIDFSPTQLAPPVPLVVGELAFFVQFARMAIGERIEPLAVTSSVLLPEVDRFTEFLGVRPKHSKRAVVSFSADDARRLFVSANLRMWDFFEPGLKERLSELDIDATTETRVRSALLELLPGGTFSITDTASHLAMSARTLQRRLTAEGTNYQSVLDSVREELAVYYLKNSTLPSAQISFLLGFKDPNSFFRAFHTWSGSTPDSVRSGELH